MKLGDKIKLLRKEKGFTQKELAAAANISRSYLADLEGNRYNPSMDVAESIAKALGVTIHALWGLPIYGEIIKSLCKEKNVTPDEINDFFDFPPKTIQNIINGVWQLNEKILYRLSEYFNVQQDYILGKTSERYEGEIDDLDVDITRAIKKLEKLSKEDRKKFIAILDLLGDKK